MSTETDAFLQKLRSFVREKRLLSPQDRILVAVSGGADSVALLLALSRLGLPMEVAHFDHQTRQGASQEDARFVATLAAKQGLTFHYESAPVEVEARMQGKSLEAHARECRYAFFVKTAQARGCTVIATGHHADDQAETILMRLIRGTGPIGVAGIPCHRKIGRLNLIRPLLFASRPEITDWLRAAGEPWRDDVTNHDTHYLRNRIRHGLFPELRKHYNQRIREALGRFSEAQRCDQSFLESLTEEALGQCVEGDRSIHREGFAAQHPALQRRMVMQLAWRNGIHEVPFERVIAAATFIIEAPTGRRFDLGEGLSLYNGRVRTEILLPGEGGEEAECAAVPLRVPGVSSALGCRFESRLLSRAPDQPLAEYCTPQRQIFDADVMSEGVVVRHRREGDRFRPFGMEGLKKLSDYFIDAGVPEPHRKDIPLLIAGDRIVWIVGHAIAAHAAIGPFTRHILEIEVRPDRA